VVAKALHLGDVERTAESKAVTLEVVAALPAVHVAVRLCVHVDG